MKEQKIVKECGPNGEIIYRLDDKETNSGDLREANDTDELFNRFSMILERFKIFIALFDDNDCAYQMALGALVKQAEDDSAQMEEVLKRVYGKIGFVCEELARYPGYRETNITGVVIFPRETDEDETFKRAGGRK